jgi:hypothetical protein
MEWHPVGFGGDGLGNGQPLDAVVALGMGIVANAVAAQRRPLTDQHHEDGDDGDEAEAEENGRIRSNDGEASRRVAGVKAHVKGATIWASRPLTRRTVRLQPVAMLHWLPREVPHLVPSVFRGPSASIVRVQVGVEAGHSSKDPVDSRFGYCIGVLAHVGGGAAGGARVV